MNHPAIFPGLDADQQDSTQVAALACSQVHPESALPSFRNAPADGYAYDEACNLAKAIYRQHYREGAENWRVLPDLRGVISQISNMVAGMTRTDRVHQLVAPTCQPGGSIYQPAAATAKLTRYEPSESGRHYADFPEGPMRVAAAGRYVRLADVEAELARAARWTPASNPPDADTTVMLALADGEVWQGYFDGIGWIEVSGLQLAPGRVTYWQHTPAHPEDRA